MYCDFLSWAGTAEQMEQYTKTLVSEIKEKAEWLKDHTVDTIFIGGGTPSIMEVSYLHKVIQAIKENVNLEETVEITMECNPGTVTQEKLMKYREMGINRISFGLQSSINRELKALGRIHSYEDFLQSWQWAREAGFFNLNVDLMSGIPEQTPKSFELTCKHIIDLNPEHISVYHLIIEQGTPFYDKYNEEPPMSEEMNIEIYNNTKKILVNAGYERYEISNYAKPGFECRHNLKYWSQREYVGFGVGAVSMINNIRWNNTDEYTIYCKEKKGAVEKCEEEVLGKKEQMEEFIIFGLRKIKGVSFLEFKDKFGEEMNDVFREVIKKYTELGVLQEEGEMLVFTNKGMDVSNMVLADFIL